MISSDTNQHLGKAHRATGTNHPSKKRSLLRHSLLAAICAAAVLSTVSCASSRRMITLSAFSSSAELAARRSKFAGNAENAPPAVDKTARRVNIWPLFYSRSEFVSILWPMIDYDKYGMAVRPFYNQEGDEYSILFPLSAWNPVNGDGWVATGYWNKHDWGVAPLFGFFGDDSGYVLPAWWNTQASGIGPFWERDHWEAVGAFPLFQHVLQGRQAKNWLFPLYIYTNDQDSNDSSLYIVWPLSGFERDQERKSKASWIFPLYYYATWQDGASHTLATLLYITHKSKRQSLTWTPLYSVFKKPSHTWRGLLSLFFFREDWREGIAVPLLGGWSDSDSYFQFSALGPILAYQKAKKDSVENKFLLWPLIDINSNFTALIDYNNTYYGCFPPLIFQHTHHAPWTFYDWDYKNILPKKRLEKTRGDSSSTTALRGLFNTTSRETGKILPLESHRKSSETPRTPKTESSFFALAYYQSHTEYKKWDADKINPKLAAEIRSALRKANSAANMLAAGKRVLKNQETREERKRIEEQIKKHEEERDAELAQLRKKLKTAGVDLKDDSPDSLFDAILELDKRFTTTEEAGRYMIPLLFDYEYDHDGKDIDWNILLFLARSETHGNAGEFKILEHFFRYEYDDKGYSMEVFPFVNVTTATEHDNVSFMWRLFRVEHEKRDGKQLGKLYLFFIPAWTW